MLRANKKAFSRQQSAFSLEPEWIRNSIIEADNTKQSHTLTTKTSSEYSRMAAG